MAQCPHEEIERSLDRWQECHWHLHQMESNYHEPEGFRYAFNSFIRAAKEIRTILMADLQRYASIRKKINREIEEFRHNELFATLSKQRDFLVHHGALDLKSHGRVQAMEGMRVKMSLPFPVAPHERSDDAYERYKETCRRDKVWRQMSGPDCDSVPTIWRTWLIPQFPGKDLLDVAFEAWSLNGKLLSAAAVAFDGVPLDLSMSCRHDPERVRIKRYDQHEFFQVVDGIDMKEEERKWRENLTQRDATKIVSESK